MRFSGIFRERHQHIDVLTVAVYNICGAFTEKTREPKMKLPAACCGEFLIPHMIKDRALVCGLIRFRREALPV